MVPPPFRDRMPARLLGPILGPISIDPSLSLSLPPSPPWACPPAPHPCDLRGAPVFAPDPLNRRLCTGFMRQNRTGRCQDRYFLNEHEHGPKSDTFGAHMTSYTKHYIAACRWTELDAMEEHGFIECGARRMKMQQVDRNGPGAVGDRSGPGAVFKWVTMAGWGRRRSGPGAVGEHGMARGGGWLARGGGGPAYCNLGVLTSPDGGSGRAYLVPHACLVLPARPCMLVARLGVGLGVGVTRLVREGPSRPVRDYTRPRRRSPP